MRYTKTLERINSVGMAWTILETMSVASDNDARLKSKTKAELVKLIVKMPGSSDIALDDAEKGKLSTARWSKRKKADNRTSEGYGRTAHWADP